MLITKPLDLLIFLTNIYRHANQSVLTISALKKFFNLHWTYEYLLSYNESNFSKWCDQDFCSEQYCKFRIARFHTTFYQGRTLIMLSLFIFRNPHKKLAIDYF